MFAHRSANGIRCLAAALALGVVLTACGPLLQQAPTITPAPTATPLPGQTVPATQPVLTVTPSVAPRAVTPSPTPPSQATPPVPATGPSPTGAAAPSGPSMGLNKMELFGEYAGIKRYAKSVAEGRAAGVRSMDDAQRLGFTYFRIAAGGFCASDYDAWRQDPNTWWAAFDQMVKDAAARNIRLIPSIDWYPYAFPDMVNEPLGKLMDPTSQSNQLLKQFTRELVSRYKDNPTILFWEVGNEFNNRADQDLQSLGTAQGSDTCNRNKVYTSADNYTSDQLAAFMNDFGSFIKSIDARHMLSSGFSVPRPTAEHMRSQPAWLSGGKQIPRDTFADMESWLRNEYPQPIDIISVHLYPKTGNTEPWTAADMYKASKDLGKTLFIGEFGDVDANGNWRADSSFVDNILNTIVSDRIPFSAPWRWEGYKTLNPPVPDTYNLDPAVNMNIIQKIVDANRKLRAGP